MFLFCAMHAGKSIAAELWAAGQRAREMNELLDQVEEEPTVREFHRRMVSGDWPIATSEERDRVE